MVSPKSAWLQMTKARFDNLIVDLGQVDAWEVQYQPAETEVFLGVYGQSIFLIRSLLKKSTRHLLFFEWEGAIRS